MHRLAGFLLFSFFALLPAPAQDASDPVGQALAQGDLYHSKRKYELALDAYRKADKLSHHSCAQCYLKISVVERTMGDFSSALDDTKRAIKVAGDNKTVAVEAYLSRAGLLAQMAGKPADKKAQGSGRGHPASSRTGSRDCGNPLRSWPGVAEAGAGS